MAMKKCKKCKQNDWAFNFDNKNKMVQATCKNCYYQVEFKAKGRKSEDPNKIHAVAKYEILDGRRFLEIDGELKEVELIKTKKYWRVMPKLCNNK